jgi:flagellar biosynthesis repressor protein FlbT
MALKVELKPGEKLLVGNCIITNSDQRTRLFIDGRVPILRQKDILTAETATSPAKRIYLAVQMMYIEDDIALTKDTYFALVNDFVAAVPSSLEIVNQINNEILTEQLYKALKAEGCSEAHRLRTGSALQCISKARKLTNRRRKSLNPRVNVNLHC